MLRNSKPPAIAANNQKSPTSELYKKILAYESYITNSNIIVQNQKARRGKFGINTNQNNTVTGRGASAPRQSPSTGTPMSGMSSGGSGTSSGGGGY